MYSIKLTKEGRALVNVYIKPFNAATLGRVIFKLDTGADLTTISKKELNVLGYTKEWITQNAVKEVNRILTSAGGKGVTAYHVYITISNVFGKDLKNWPFYILIEDDKDFPNLLGIDVLSHFNFSLNYDTGFLEAEAAINPVINLPMKDHQEICDIT